MNYDCLLYTLDWTPYTDQPHTQVLTHKLFQYTVHSQLFIKILSTHQNTKFIQSTKCIGIWKRNIIEYENFIMMIKIFISIVLVSRVVYQYWTKEGTRRSEIKILTFMQQHTHRHHHEPISEFCTYAKFKGKFCLETSRQLKCISMYLFYYYNNVC